MGRAPVDVEVADRRVEPPGAGGAEAAVGVGHAVGRRVVGADPPAQLLAERRAARLDAVRDGGEADDRRVRREVVDERDPGAGPVDEPFQTVDHLGRDAAAVERVPVGGAVRDGVEQRPLQLGRPMLPRETDRGEAARERPSRNELDLRPAAGGAEGEVDVGERGAAGDDELAARGVEHVEAPRAVGVHGQRVVLDGEPPRLRVVHRRGKPAVRRGVAEKIGVGGHDAPPVRGRRAASVTATKRTVAPAASSRPLVAPWRARAVATCAWVSPAGAAGRAGAFMAAGRCRRPAVAASAGPALRSRRGRSPAGGRAARAPCAARSAARGSRWAG